MPSKTRPPREGAAPPRPRKPRAATAAAAPAPVPSPESAAVEAPAAAAAAVEPSARRRSRRAAAPVVEPAPAPAPRRRRKAAAAEPADAAPAAAPPAIDSSSAPAPAPEPPPAKAARRRGTAKPRVQAPPVPEAAPEPPPPAPPPAQVDPPPDGVLFGRYAVQIPGEEAAEVTLRAADAGTALCTCLDFALSDDARCPHVDAVLADAGRAAAIVAAPRAVASRIVLAHGAQARLHWLPGAECPPALDAQARALLQPATPDDQALPRLLRAAREAGHELQVDEAVWAQLAQARDARWRVHRLEQLLPQGPHSEALRALAPEPLLPLQVEGALFALCAGRCVLADCAELQPQRQALAAATLWARHFGVERVLVLAPAEALDGWRRALPPEGAAWSLMDIDRVAGDVERHRALAPELVIVHEPAAGGLWVDAERAAALLRLRSAHAIVLPPADWMQHPAELPLRLAFVDAARQGAYASLLAAHGERDEAGQLCGLRALDGVRETLAPVLLARPLDEVRAQLPERVERVRRVPLPPEVHECHAGGVTLLAAELERWQRVGWLPDAEQRRLRGQVQALRRLCAGDAAPAMAAAKAAAVQELLAGGDHPVAKLVVFTQWPGALHALQAALQGAGIGARRWCADEPEAERRAAVQAFQDDDAVRVLIVADAGSGGLELRCPGAQVLHLDRPWHPRTATRRFGRVHRRGKAHLVPVTQLLAAGSLEDAIASVIGDRHEPPVAEWLDANAAEGFLQGDELAQWLQDLAAVLAACGAAGATANV